MKFTECESSFFEECLKPIKENSAVASIKINIHHGDTTTYAHCEQVALCSYWLCLHLHLKMDRRSLIRGAFLHDFYLYDWHIKDASHRLHGYSHSASALKNASLHFELNDIEKNIIYSHMWPLNITRVPKSREAVLVGFADRLCSLADTFKRSSKKN